jgi:CRISPR-associated protein Cst1
MSVQLRWTGHPLADVGVATLCAMVNKVDPNELTAEDLDTCGQELSQAYNDPIFLSYLTCVFPNSAYVNPTMKGDNRIKAVQRLLFPHHTESDEGVVGLYCAFSGLPATHLLERSQMPMLTGVGILNFFPAGQSELPVAAPFLLAIQAVPMGGRRSEGKLLMVHCDDPQWTLQFAGRYLATNRRLINLARSGKLPETDGPDERLDRECAGWDKTNKRPKYPDAKAPHSLIMDDLMDVVTQRVTGRMARASASVTAYLMSNSGQGPSLSIEHIPSQFVRFLQLLHGTQYAQDWRLMVARSWRSAQGADESSGSKKPSKGKSAQPLPAGPGRSRNELYNDLLRMFPAGFIDWNAAVFFIRRHLLSDPARLFASGHPSLSPRLSKQRAELINWNLTALFLEQVLGMNKERLEQIRKFADQLGELIEQHNDRRLFRELVFTEKEWPYRAILTKVQRRYAQEKHALLFGFDQYLDIFLANDGEKSVNWSLVRDLISIRLVEQLFSRGFFARSGNEELLESSEEQEAA